VCFRDKPLILADGMSKYFSKNGGPFVAVNDCSFHVNKGECFGLLGKTYIESLFSKLFSGNVSSIQHQSVNFTNKPRV
jgi:ABC-type dipeptide/oligopeptide/nickel transport system ATPase subunit